MKNNVEPQVTLVGAGPGDPDLLTIKGQKHWLKRMLFYDALANEELLSLLLKKH
jgi:uroporphyrin-III C-methyltransferase